MNNQKWDGFQAIIILICLLELSNFVAFLFAFEVNNMDMISDTLFDKKPYAILLDIFMTFRFIFGAMYFYRFVRETLQLFVIGNIGIIVGLFGWFWLSTHMDSINHPIGVGCFCSGTILYSFICLRLAAKSREHSYFVIYDTLEWFLITTTILLGLLFISLWISSDKISYLPEHLAYIFHLLFYMVFMAYHTPNPFKVVSCFTDSIIPEQCASLVTNLS